MGAWGEGPTDNDTAADLADDLNTKTIYEVITEGLASEDVDEQRVAAWLITRLGDPLINEKMLAHVKVALDQMKALLADDEWISEWDNVLAIRKAVQKQIDDLSNLLWEPVSEKCKECQVEEHDTCSMTDGCPCCDETKRQLSP